MTTEPQEHESIEVGIYEHGGKFFFRPTSLKTQSQFSKPYNTAEEAETASMQWLSRVDQEKLSKWGF